MWYSAWWWVIGLCQQVPHHKQTLYRCAVDIKIKGGCGLCDWTTMLSLVIIRQCFQLDLGTFLSKTLKPHIRESSSIPQSWRPGISFLILQFMLTVNLAWPEPEARIWKDTRHFLHGITFFSCGVVHVLINNVMLLFSDNIWWITRFLMHLISFNWISLIIMWYHHFMCHHIYLLRPWANSTVCWA